MSRQGWLIAIAWWGLGLTFMAPAAGDLGFAAGFWGQLPWSGMLTPGLAGAAGRHAILLLLAAVLALAFAGLGGEVVRVIRPRGPGARDRHALGLLFGFGVPGFTGFALALCGLAFAPLLWAVAAAGLFLPGARACAGAAGRGLPRPPAGRGWLALALAPLVPVALVMLVPDAHVDVLTYHLAIPDQVLRVHKFTTEGASVAHGFPLAAEFVYALAIPLGRDELAHWMQAIPFLAAVALVAGWAAGRWGPVAGWAAAAAILTCGTVGQQITVAKNDLAAAAYAMAGATGIARALEAGGGGWLAASGLLFGVGCGVKFNVGILAAVALACMLPFGRLRRGLGGWLVLAALPALPWLARSWLWFGDPLWPALSGWWPGAWWRPEDAQSVAIARGWAGPWAALRDLAGGAGGFLWRDMPAVALALPFLLFGQAVLGAPGRWLFGFGAASTVVCTIMMRSEWARLAAPALFLLGALAAVAAAGVARGWGRWGRRTALAAAGLACWLPLGYFLGTWVPPVPTVPYLAGAVPRETWRTERLTTLEGARLTLASLPDPGSRMILIGDIRTFRLPARILSVRNYGCTWAWEMAKAAPSRARVRVRFRQLGVRHVLYNLLTEGFPHPIVEPYVWDDRMLAVWREFVERDLELAVRPSRMDNLNGCFCVWRLRETPAAVRPAFLPYLPGVESLYYAVTSQRDVMPRLEAALRLDRRIPNVDYVADRIAQAFFEAGDWRSAWDWLQPSLRHDTLDDGNYWGAAIVAAHLSRFADAERFARQAAESMPERRESVEEWIGKLRAFAARRKSPGPGLPGGPP